MVAKTLRRVTFSALVLIGTVLWISALLLLAQTTQNSAQFARLQNWILIINAIGVAVFLILIAGSLFRLVRDYRQHIAGSRLKARMVAMFVVLAVVPLLLVYYFSVQFLNRGIDSWFRVEIEQALDDALSLSKTSLDINMQEYLTRTEGMAETLSNLRNRRLVSDNHDLVSELGLLRRESGAIEITLVGQNSRIIATSSDHPADVVPRPPTEEVLLQLRQGRPYVGLHPTTHGYDIHVAASVRTQAATAEQWILLGMFPVADRLATLADSVQTAYNEYGELAYLRGPLKYSFTLTLTMILLLSLLTAVYGAFFSARRLFQPIQNLVAGTQAVAKGDLDTRLPKASHDEMGFLVNSFNDMTRRLREAREQAGLSRQEVENERANLAIILARLSTGVVSLENDLRIRTANQAAGAILGVDLENRVGELLPDAARGHALLTQFLDAWRAHSQAGDTDWREQIVLHGQVGRRVLMCACTSLPDEDGAMSGSVVVFDDITALLQAQRDAAWGEVARRLAHEIKNPLTPIQLSAERMRKKYLGTMEKEDAQVLERATHTIVQQVEAMKEMVNAFSDYARAPDMEFSHFDINELVSEVADLYRAKEMGIQLSMNLDRNIPTIEADDRRIRQILHNLMRNALEAMDGREDSKVELVTRLKDEEDYLAVEILVVDNGPGFQMEIEQVFDPYVTSKPKGTGLGLAIVKKLVDEHGGRIDAENSDQGGARIRIVLPVDETARTAMLPMASRRQEIRREQA